MVGGLRIEIAGRLVGQQHPRAVGDRARNRDALLLVLKDEVLVELALPPPRNTEALANLRAIPRGMGRSRAGGEILAAVERGFERDSKKLRPFSRLT